MLLFIIFIYFSSLDCKVVDDCWQDLSTSDNISSLHADSPFLCLATSISRRRYLCPCGVKLLYPRTVLSTYTSVIISMSVSTLSGTCFVFISSNNSSVPFLSSICDFQTFTFPSSCLPTSDCAPYQVIAFCTAVEKYSRNPVVQHRRLKILKPAHYCSSKCHTILQLFL